MKRMLKTFSMLVPLLLVLLPKGYAATLSVPTINTDHGTVVEVPIMVDDATGMAGYQMTVTFDPDILTCRSAVAGGLTSAWITGQNANVSGQVLVSGYDPDLTGLSGGGNLVRLLCTAVGGQGKASDICIKSVKLVNAFGNEMAFTVSGCSVFRVVDPCLFPIRNTVGSQNRYYQTIQDAYGEATSGDVIRLQAVDLAGNVSLSRSIVVTLKGGYNCNYTGSAGLTNVQGVVTVANGLVIMDEITIE